MTGGAALYIWRHQTLEKICNGAARCILKNSGRNQILQLKLFCFRYKVIVYSTTSGGGANRHMGGGGGGVGGGRWGASRGGLHSSARFTRAICHIVIIWGLSVLLSLPLIFAMELARVSAARTLLFSSSLGRVHNKCVTML